MKSINVTGGDEAFSPLKHEFYVTVLHLKLRCRFRVNCKAPLTVIPFSVEAKRVGENTDCLMCQSHVTVRHRYLVLAKGRLCA